MEGGFHITGIFCCSFLPILLRHVIRIKALPILPVPLSHGPRICVLYFLAVTSCWVFCASFVKAGNTEEVPWRLRAAFPVAQPLFHPTWPSTKGTGAAVLLDLVLSYTRISLLHPGYTSTTLLFCSLKTRCGVRKDSLDAELLQNLQLDICDIAGVKRGQDCLLYTVSFSCSQPRQFHKTASAFNCLVLFLATVSYEITEGMTVSLVWLYI